VNYESDAKPAMMAPDRHSPIVDAIEIGASLSCGGYQAEWTRAGKSGAPSPGRHDLESLVR
jgi:hypothetical protein